MGGLNDIQAAGNVVDTTYQDSAAHQLSQAVNNPCEVDTSIVETIESEGDPNAVSPKGAQGLMQIMEGGALADWNKDFPDTPYKMSQMKDPEINRSIGGWYMNTKIPTYIKNYGVEDSIKNRLIMYNAGPTAGVKIIRGEKEMSKETKDYISKYFMHITPEEVESE